MIKDHSKYPLQTVFGADCKRRGRSPRQPAGEGSTDSFLVSARSFLFSHFCCIHISPARCRSRKETGKVKVTHAQALPLPSCAPLQKSQILAAETRSPRLPRPDKHPCPVHPISGWPSSAYEQWSNEEESNNLQLLICALILHMNCNKETMGLRYTLRTQANIVLA